jgi:hypothetical protein
MRDLRVLFWLRWRQFKDDAVYWLRVLGYDPREKALTQRIYVIYLLAIAAFWVVAMWAFAYDSAVGLGRGLPPEGLANVARAVPLVVVVIQVLALMGALSSTPLKLSFADIAYVAGSPLSRAALVLLGFIRQTVTRVVPAVIVAALVGTVLGAAVDITTAGWASLRAGLMAIPLVVMTWGAAWGLGLLRLIDGRVRRMRFLWLMPPLLLALAYFLPDVALWPGRGLVLAAWNESPWWLWLLVLALALAAGAAVTWLGRRVNMIYAVDESVVHARIQALGLMAWRQPDLQLRIRRQTASASRRAFLKLPSTVRGAWTLMARASLSYIRHPLMLLLTLGWGALLTQAGVLMVTSQLPAQLWIGWLLLIGVAPPAGLMYAFRADQEDGFLRQFLPVDGIQLLAADVAFPLLFLAAGGIVVWLIQGFTPAEMALGVLAIPLLAVLLTLCGAVALTTQRVLQTRLLATAASFGAAMIAATQLGAVAGLLVAAFAVLVLAGLVAQRA